MLFANQWLKLKVIIIIVYGFLPGLVYANELLTIIVTDNNDEFVEHAVISVYPQSEHYAPAVANKMIVIDQVDKEFIDHVTAIQVGTRIEFPNHDQIHHHVYSFSTAKTFEIPLYKDAPENPVLFDKVGVVSLGCNIHDWMAAYIYVTDTAYFATTNNQGQAFIELPSGSYKIRTWHPNIDEKSTHSASVINISPGYNQTASVLLGLKKVWSLRRGPLSSFNRGRYR